MAKFAASDGNVSRTTRWRMRVAGEACVKRKPGRKPKKSIKQLSRSAAFARKAKRRATRIIVVGAGPGRVGSTAVAAHLQREGFYVTHESGNTKSVNFDKAAAVTDHFNLFAKPKEFKQSVADQKILNWLDRASGARVVGDISLTNTQHGGALASGQAGRSHSVSYTHLTLPTKRIV